jgi:uncharacterized protein YqgC (DUF456 family)
VLTADLLVGLAIAVGVVGVLVPFVPGSGLVAVAILVWALVVDTTLGWVFAAVAGLLLGVGIAVKYAVPGRHLRAKGVPTRTLLIGAVLALVGFFVIPVVGLLVGFVLGVYLSELQRVGRRGAWPATKAAVKAVGLSMLIELTAAMAAAAVWLAGALAT